MPEDRRSPRRVDLSSPDSLATSRLTFAFLRELVPTAALEKHHLQPDLFSIFVCAPNFALTSSTSFLFPLFVPKSTSVSSGVSSQYTCVHGSR